MGEGEWGSVGEGKTSLHMNHSLFMKEDPKLVAPPKFSSKMLMSFLSPWGLYLLCFTS